MNELPCGHEESMGFAFELSLAEYLRKALCRCAFQSFFVKSALLCWLLLVQAVAAVPSTNDSNYLDTDFIARAFTAVVHGREYAAGSFELSRWPDDIQYYIHQDVADPLAVVMIEMHLQQLGDISGRRFVKVPIEDARLEIYLTRQQGWQVLVANRVGASAIPDLHGAVCYASFNTRSGTIEAAQVFIPVDQARMHGKLVSCVVEELTQVMGLPNDSELVFPSIFNDRTPDDLLTPLDWVLIRLLYHPDLVPGMVASQSTTAVRALLRQWQADGTLQSAAVKVKQGELYRMLGRR